MPAEQRRRYKFTASFDQVFGSEDVEVICCVIGRLGRALAERWVGTARCEVLDHQLKLHVKPYVELTPERGGAVLFLGAAGSDRASRARRSIANHRNVHLRLGQRRGEVLPRLRDQIVAAASCLASTGAASASSFCASRSLAWLPAPAR